MMTTVKELALILEKEFNHPSTPVELLIRALRKKGDLGIEDFARKVGSMRLSRAKHPMVAKVKVDVTKVIQELKKFETKVTQEKKGTEEVKKQVQLITSGLSKDELKETAKEFTKTETGLSGKNMIALRQMIQDKFIDMQKHGGFYK